MKTNLIETYTGYLEKKAQGTYSGELTIEGVNISPVVGVFFKAKKEKSKYWLWLRRKDVMRYDSQTKTFTKHKARPYWECYLEKQEKTKNIAYVGYFYFMHFKFRLVGIWDKVMKDKDRLNLYAERLPLREQSLIKNIYKKKHYYEKGG